MEQIRKGNDIKVYWEIIAGGDGSEIPYELEGKALELYAQNAYEKVRISDFVANGNVIEWTFYGKDQKTAGVYSLTLIENNGSEGMRTVDECNAFELVTHSCKAGGNAESRVSIETVRLRSVMTLSDVVPDKELNKNSTNVVENGAIAREFEKQKGAIANKQDIIPDLARIREGASKGATALQEHQDISGKANTSGRYPDMSVGFADDLVGRGESVPAEFSFRASGGKSIKDGAARIKRLKGNSVVWNQGFPDREWDVQDGSLTREGETYIVTPTGGYPGIVMNNMRDSMPRAGDKVLILCDFWTEGGQHSNYIAVNLGGNQTRIVGLEQGKWLSVSIFLTADKDNPNNGTNLFGASASQDTQILKFKNMRYHNLTQMFQAGNEPTTIEEFNARVATLGVDLYAYNEGQVIHMTAEGIKSVGDNALNADRSLVFDFDGSYGNYDFINTEDAFVGISADGYVRKEAIDYAEKIEGGFRFRSNGGGYGIGMFVKALPNEEYSVSYTSDNGRIAFGFYDKDKNFISYDLWENRFTTPSNCEYIMLCLRDNEVVNIDMTFTDIMLTLVHSGWKQDTDAKYQPYWEDRLMFDKRIKDEFPDGMPKWDMVYNKNGKGYVNKGMRVVDLGSLDWIDDTFNGVPTFTTKDITNGVMRSIYDSLSGSIIALYSEMIEFGRLATSDNKVFVFNSIAHAPNTLAVRDTAYTNASEFKAAMNGVMFYYQLAEPTIIEYDEPFNLDYLVWDFGTEEIIADKPSAPLKADIIYQFNAVDMIREHELEITELQRIIATMQAQLTSLTSNNGGQ